MKTETIFVPGIGRFPTVPNARTTSNLRFLLTLSWALRVMGVLAAVTAVSGMFGMHWVGADFNGLLVLFAIALAAFLAYSCLVRYHWGRWYGMVLSIALPFFAALFVGSYGLYTIPLCSLSFVVFYGSRDLYGITGLEHDSISETLSLRTR